MLQSHSLLFTGSLPTCTLLHEVSSEDGDGAEATCLLPAEGLELCAALRIMEVRAAYCKDDFEWHMMQSLANKDMNDANVALLRSNAESSFKRTSSMQQRDAES